MTAKGLVIIEEEQDISGLSSTSSPHDESTHTHIPLAVNASESSLLPKTKSPIAELLYMRWLEGLRIKWPSLLSSS